MKKYFQFIILSHPHYQAKDEVKIFFLFLMGLRLELRASWLQSRHTSSAKTFFRIQDILKNSNSQPLFPEGNQRSPKIHTQGVSHKREVRRA
jgi:hypothetical protein